MIDWTPELEEAICTAIALTPKGLEHICKANPSFPNPDTIYLRRNSNDNFSEKYTRAKAAQVMILADQIVEIADDAREDIEQTDDGPVVNREVIERTKIRIDARKWLASKLAPKIYGDKMAHTGEDGGPMQFVVKSILDKGE